MNENSQPEYVSLPGITLPQEALALALRLEREGWIMRRKGDKLSVTRPTTTGGSQDQAPLGTGQTGQVAEKTGQTLQLEDREAITKWRDHLLAVCDMVEATR